MLQRKMSVAALREQTGVSERLIVKYRTGRVVPRDYFGRPSANALKIANALGLDVDELFPAREELAA